MSGSLPATVPVTIRLEQQLDHEPALVFDAYADVDQRAQWGPPPGEIVVFRSHDFRIGGTDHFVRGARPSPRISGTTHYEQIVDNERVAFVERLVDSDDQLLTMSLVTWTIAPSETGTLLAVTDQTTSVFGSRPIEGWKYRYTVMLDRLTQHLANTAG